MGRVAAGLNDILTSTETARMLNIHPVTLRRNMKDFREWLAANRKPELKFVQLSNGKRVWEFGNSDRVNLRAFFEEKRLNGRIDIKNAPPPGRERMTPEQKREQFLIRRYVRTLADLRILGIAPKEQSLVRVNRRRIPDP